MPSALVDADDDAVAQRGPVGEPDGHRDAGTPRGVHQPLAQPFQRGFAVAATGERCGERAAPVYEDVELLIPDRERGELDGVVDHW